MFSNADKAKIISEQADAVIETVENKYEANRIVNVWNRLMPNGWRLILHVVPSGWYCKLESY